MGALVKNLSKWAKGRFFHALGIIYILNSYTKPKNHKSSLRKDPLHFFGTKFSSLHADVLQQRIIFTAYHSSMTREFSSEKAR